MNGVGRIASGAGLLLAATVAGAALATRRADQRLRRQRAAWRDRLHQRVLPGMHAAERELVAGEVDRGLAHLRAAVAGARTLLTPPGIRDPIGDAVSTAARLWAPRLRIDTRGAEQLPDDLVAPVVEAVRSITLEALNNAARHGAGAPVRVGLSVRERRVELTVADAAGEGAARTAARVGDVVERSGATGYGLPAMQRVASDVGGRVSVHLAADGTLVHAVLPRRSVRRIGATLERWSSSIVDRRR